jgi:hypothetical protein
VVGKAGGKGVMGGVGLGDHQQAAGVLVDPVDDPRALHPADPGQAVAAMGDQRVDQRVLRRARCGVDGHSGGLVDHDQCGVFVDDRQGQVLGFGYSRGRFGNVNSVCGTRFDRAGGVGYGRAVDEQAAI